MYDWTTDTLYRTYGRHLHRPWEAGCNVCLYGDYCWVLRAVREEIERRREEWRV